LGAKNYTLRTWWWRLASDWELVCWLWHCAATAVALKRHEHDVLYLFLMPLLMSSRWRVKLQQLLKVHFWSYELIWSPENWPMAQKYFTVFGTYEFGWFSQPEHVANNLQTGKVQWCIWSIKIWHCDMSKIIFFYSNYWWIMKYIYVSLFHWQNCEEKQFRYSSTWCIVSSWAYLTDPPVSRGNETLRRYATITQFFLFKRQLFLCC